MGAVEFDYYQFHNPGSNVIYTYVLLQLVEKIFDFPHPV